MAEMIVPGTYIEVRAEGLISAGGVATGIVGVVGTASSGPIGVPVTLSGYAEARDLFGLPDDFGVPLDGSNPLTLIRALQLVYGNGASNVIAVRVASSRAAAATYILKDSGDHAIATMTAATSGTWANELQISVSQARLPAQITGEKQTSGFSALNYHDVLPSNQTRLQVLRGDTREVDTFDIVYRVVARDEAVAKNSSGIFQLANTSVVSVESINSIIVRDAKGVAVQAYGANPPDNVTAGTIIYNSGDTPQTNEVRLNPSTGELGFEANQNPAPGQSVIATYAVDHAEPKAGEVLITVWNGDLDFPTGEAPRAASGDVLTANYQVEAADSVEVTLSSGTLKETYVVVDGKTLSAQAAISQLVTVTPDSSNGGAKPTTGVTAVFGTGTNTGGSNGADADATDYAAGLDTLANMIVNIVLLAGQDASMALVLDAHLQSTEQTDYERLGVIGAPGATIDSFLGHRVSSDRIVLTAPGIKNIDGSTLPSGYTAAAIAGMISALPVQVSLTNKGVNLPGLTIEANRGQQEQLIQKNVLCVVPKLGLRVLKGVTTDGVGDPFSAIPTRRIVDFAKYGVRSAANPYIGRLNNARVRSALKATLDAFLTSMVEDEALTAYTLDVSATRAQEIAGVVNIVMTLQPTFSIDYIRVVMTLQ